MKNVKLREKKKRSTDDTGDVGDRSSEADEKMKGEMR